ncbi:sulfate adenylyltransferase [Streptomyces sp. SMC 277]|uniref:Sulfate adenylyltransferase n=1 Tax=Streptomyces antimicrobicus TaxID=2883108 RepID=A0ABS8BD48_9ACTN|nr:sulfate adenylyltransferase [Streptomyces antimicrobicus]
MRTDIYAGFAKEGGRIGSGRTGSGQGGVARCVRCAR